MTGLKRGTVKLCPHQKEWDEIARDTIEHLKRLLGDRAFDIQHVGSTSIPGIWAKPIIDIVVAADRPEDIMCRKEIMEEYS